MVVAGTETTHEHQAAEEVLSELRQPLWAVTDGVTCFGCGLTYDQAVNKMFELPDKCAIVTIDAASRLIKSI